MISVGDVLVELKRPVLRSPLRKITILNILLALMLPVRIRVSFTASSLETISIPPVRLISVRIYVKPSP